MDTIARPTKTHDEPVAAGALDVPRVIYKGHGDEGIAFSLSIEHTSGGDCVVWLDTEIDDLAEHGHDGIVIGIDARSEITNHIDEGIAFSIPATDGTAHRALQSAVFALADVMSELIKAEGAGVAS